MSNLVFTGQRLPSAYVADFDKLLERATAAIQKPRPYTARVSRTSPTAFVFLLDQSGSMAETLDTRQGEVPKAKFLADAVNDLLNQLISECRRSGEYRNYMDICVIGYGGDDDNTAKYAWEGDLSEKSFVTIQELKDHPVDTNGSRGVWITARAQRLTPMKQALELAHDTLVQAALRTRRKGTTVANRCLLAVGEFGWLACAWIALQTRGEETPTANRF